MCPPMIFVYYLQNALSYHADISDFSFSLGPPHAIINDNGCSWLPWKSFILNRSN